MLESGERRSNGAMVAGVAGGATVLDLAVAGIGAASAVGGRDVSFTGALGFPGGGEAGRGLDAGRP